MIFQNTSGYCTKFSIPNILDNFSEYFNIFLGKSEYFDLHQDISRYFSMLHVLQETLNTL